MIEPTNRLMEIALKHKVYFVFFIDAGYLWQLKNQAHIQSCKNDFVLVSEQIKQLVKQGHEIGLHIHPHWEDCIFENNAWKINVSRYKLSDFNENEIENIITKYHETIINIVGNPCRSFRAGGWCIQPFSKIKPALLKNNIFIDSSVYKNGYHQFSAQSYDFRNAPDKTEWNFENDECVEDSTGKFTEVAISSDHLPPTFFVNLYLKMKIDPAEFRPMGDGSWLKDKKKIYRQFYSYTNHFACCDGFFASRLKTILLKLESEKKKRMVVLGHPKSLAECSFKYLDEFISFSTKKGYNIVNLDDDLK